MASQIFKSKIPTNLITELLEAICSKNEKYYIMNNDAFKKGLFNNVIPNFIDECKPYYHLSKQKYLDRKLTYNSFMTIVRQICKLNKITYTSHIKYDKSEYDIIYFIYHTMN